MEVKKQTTIITTEDHRLELTDNDLRAMMLAAGYELPPGAEMYVRVPGGGDWSNTSLDVNKECPVIVTWQIKKENTK